MAFYNNLFKFYTIVGYGIRSKTNQTIAQFLKSVPANSNANLLFTTLLNKRISGNLKISSLIANSQYFNRIDEAIRIVETADSIDGEEEFKENYPTYIQLANGVGFENGVFSITDKSSTTTITVSGSSLTLESTSGNGTITSETLLFSPLSFEAGQQPAAGTYTNVIPSTDGSGSGAKLTVVVAEGDRGTFIDRVTVTDGGLAYGIGDTLAISTEQLGGSEGEVNYTEATLKESNISSPLLEQSIIMTPAGISMPNLPTSDPGIVGLLWNNKGFLGVSLGR